MNPQYYRNSEIDPAAASTPGEKHPTRDRGSHADHPRPPPAVPYRRYPSLSDDGQPYFPRLQRARRSSGASGVERDSTSDSDRPQFFSVRAFAFLALVAIIAFLVASA